MTDLEGKRTKVLNSISLNAERPSRSKQFGKTDFKKQVLKEEITNSRKEEKVSNSITILTSSVSNVANKKIETNSKIKKKYSNKTNVSLFVGNLPNYVTEATLKKEFKDHKSILSIKVCRDSATKKSLGYGYINFSGSEGAEQFTEEYNYRSLFDGTEIKIMPSLRNSFYRKNIGTNVFFCNLPLNDGLQDGHSSSIDQKLTTRIFYETFRKFGKILSCKLDVRKNIGFVYYENDVAAKKAISSYNNKMFYGKKILCGLHFDKNVRSCPDFEQKKKQLDSGIFIKEELLIENNEVTNKVCEEKNTELQDPKFNPNNELETTSLIISNDSQNRKKIFPNSIFIKNLPIDTTDDEILNHFSKIGPLKSVFSSKVSKFDSIWSIITYKRNLDACNAITHFNNTEFKDRIIQLAKAHSKDILPSTPKSEYNNRTPSSEVNNSVVYINNLNEQCNETFLTKLLGESGKTFEEIKFSNPWNDKKKYRISGQIKCQTSIEALRIQEFLNKKLIFGNVVHASTKSKFANNPPETRLTQPSRNCSVNSYDSSIGYPVYPNPYYYQYFYNKNYYNNNMTVPCYFYPINSNKITKWNHIKERNVPGNESNELLNKLKDIIKINFSTQNRNTSELKDPDFTCISEYMLKVYWRNNNNKLQEYLNLYTSSDNDNLLEKQILEASKFLGYDI